MIKWIKSLWAVPALEQPAPEPQAEKAPVFVLPARTCEKCSTLTPFFISRESEPTLCHRCARI